MAKLASLNRYYRRNGTSFLAMEHFELADMFGRRARPKLKITTHIKGIGIGAEIVICLKNEGRGSARAPYLALNIRRGPFKLAAHGLSGGGYDGMTRKKAPTRGYSVAFAEGSNFVIHPGVELDVTLYHTGIMKLGASLDRDVEIDYALCAESCPLEEGTIVIPLAKLLR